MHVKERLSVAIKEESHKFEECYKWLEKSMSEAFFEEISHEQIMLVTHSLMDFPLQDNFSLINLKNGALALCLNTPDADLRILKNFSLDGICHYHAFVSNCPPPYECSQENLRVVFISFTEIDNYTQFLSSLKKEQQESTLQLLEKAKTTDHCQYHINSENPLEIVLAWRNTPKYHFLHRVAKTTLRHKLAMHRVNATYVNPYSKDSILVMCIGLQSLGGNHSPVEDLIRDIVTLKYFDSFDLINKKLVTPELITRLMGNFLRSASNFIHQALVNIDPYIYTLEHIEEDLCRHPELTVKLCDVFRYKCDPEVHNQEVYCAQLKELEKEIKTLDTGHEENDKRRRNVLMQGLNLIEHTLKTNLFQSHYTAISFRLDPHYLNYIPFAREEKFPKLPYGIFFVKGLDFFGFHIRFGDLARGGLRTVFPEQVEHMLSESNNVFNECYNLAYTQHEKNKDIPEAGAKGVIFIGTYNRLEAEADILRKELSADPEIQEKLCQYKKEQKKECLYLAQRSFVESIVALVNCHQNGILKADRIIDYWQRPEYLYLGPDENMHNEMIQWIADYSKRTNYKPGTSFITSKPKTGMNHKMYGVTSLGVNVYMEEVLKFLGINPKKEIFTIKISGGPDGDVAGNQILNLKKHYPNTAKIIALTDISGTIYDPQGLDFESLSTLFQKSQSINQYPPEKLSEGGFLLDRFATQKPSALITQTLCWKVENHLVKKEWISGSEMNHLYRQNVHSTYADIFIPAGGRPRTLNEENWKEYLDVDGKPTSKAIVEGANLYLTQQARENLEEKGVLIIRDSSANKTGVICSSLEVLIGLAIDDNEFLRIRDQIIPEMLDRLKDCALREAQLLLKTHQQTSKPLTEISESISQKINLHTYQLLDHLEKTSISTNPEDPLTACYLSYCLPYLRTHFSREIMEKIPEHHMKAIIACQIGAQVVYSRGIDWSPSIVDILPIIWK